MGQVAKNTGQTVKNIFFIAALCGMVGTCVLEKRANERALLEAQLFRNSQRREQQFQQLRMYNLMRELGIDPALVEPTEEQIEKEK